MGRVMSKKTLAVCQLSIDSQGIRAGSVLACREGVCKYIWQRDVKQKGRGRLRPALSIAEYAAKKQAKPAVLLMETPRALEFMGRHLIAQPHLLGEPS